MSVPISPHPKRLELPVRIAVLRLTEPQTTSRRRYHLRFTLGPPSGQNQEPRLPESRDASAHRIGAERRTRFLLSRSGRGEEQTR